MKILYTISLIFATTFSFAQNSDTSNDIPPTTSFGFNMETIWNFQDDYIGFSAGIENLKNDFGVRATFTFRPFYKKVQIKESDFLWLYMEKKFVVSVDGEKRYLPIKLKKSKVGVFGLLKVGFMFGDYRGTKEKPQAGIVFIPSAGGIIALDNTVFIKLGYSYFNDKLTSVSDNKIFIGMTFAIH